MIHLEQFDSIRCFFEERSNKYVEYTVNSNPGNEHTYYFSPPPFQRDFYIRFASPHLSEVYQFYRIDSYDSFVFGIYFIDYGNRIEVSDMNRTWECGVEAFEGTGLMAKHLPLVKQKVEDYGFDALNFGLEMGKTTELHKVTTEKTFVSDAISLVELMLLINHIKPTPPHLRKNKYIRQEIDALQKSWS